LQNVIESSVVLSNGNEHLGVSDLPEELKELTIPDDIPIGSFHEALQSFKKELVRSALRMNSGNKLRAASELGISRCYLHRLLNQFGMADKDAEPEQHTSLPSREMIEEAQADSARFSGTTKLFEASR
jgi:transcriptional regulator of acetoin/glycerol metabolism